MRPDAPRVLIVDDVEANLRAVSAALRGVDAELETASSGRAAASRILRAEFAVVLLDVMMPEMSGFEVAELIRTHEPTQHTPIIFLTGMGHDEQMVFEGYEKGAVDYLLKPVDSVILRSKVDVFLRLYRQSQALSVLADLRRTQEELSLAHRDLESFVNSIFHDLMEPARTVSTALEAMAAEIDGASGATRWLETAQARSERLLKMLVALRQYVDAGRDDAYRISTDLNDTLRSVLAEHAGAIQAVGARVELGELPAVYGRPSQLRLLFRHLIDNAIKFRSPKRDLRITIGSARVPETPNVRIAVRDNGLGIEEAAREKLFMAFSHLKRRDEYEGAHLGLAICRRIVETHGGSISAVAPSGPGALIEVVLPGVGSGEADPNVES